MHSNYMRSKRVIARCSVARGQHVQHVHDHTLQRAQLQLKP
jgi:hypothetical protein